MEIYIVMLFILLICWKIDKKQNKKIKIIPFVVMALVGGFRYNVGRDYDNYVNAFSYIVSGISFKAEFLYRYLVLFVHKIGGTQQLVFLIVEIITCYLYFKFIYDNANDFYLSSLIYLCIGPYYFSSYNTIREALAVAIFLNSLKYLKENKNIYKFILCLSVGFFVHKSILIGLIFIIIKDKFKKNYILSLIGVIGIFSLIINSGIVEKVLSMFNGDYDHYISTFSQDMDFSYIIFGLIAILILILNYYSKIEIEDVYLNMDIMAIVVIGFAFFTGRFTMLFTRIASYFTPLFIIVIPQILQCFKQKKIAKFIIVFACIVYFTILITTNEDLNPYNYSFKLFV